MFQRNDVVRVVAPTGTAAFNVGGETFHHWLELKVSNREYNLGGMSREKRKRLVGRLRHLLCLIVDERSLVSSQLLGTAEATISETAFNGGHVKDLSWGGIPVVILVGDDYQLQGTTEGAIETLHRTDKGAATKRGRKAFLECSRTVFELNRIRRVSDKEEAAKALMNRIRLAEDITDDDANKLLGLRLEKMKEKHGKDYVDKIRSKAIYLFYTNEKRMRHNLEMVRLLSDKWNPTAFLKTKSTGKTRGKGQRSHFAGSEIPKTSIIFNGSKVALENRNLCPLWGLHNGACGTIKEIIFETGQSPLTGDFPAYVVVEFPLYTGPPWDLDNPKVSKISESVKNYSNCNFSQSRQSLQLVPIPVTEFRCSNNCCTRTFLPLSVSYARTIHKFQGLSAGPVDEGKIPNIYEVIICDPDAKKVEGRCTGLLYTALSRATTLGDPDGRNSAIYFDGPEFNFERIRYLAKKQNQKDDFTTVVHRRQWVQHLRKHTKKPHRLASCDGKETLPQKYAKLFAWATETRVSEEVLRRRIDAYTTERVEQSHRTSFGYANSHM